MGLLGTHDTMLYTLLKLNIFSDVHDNFNYFNLIFGTEVLYRSIHVFFFFVCSLSCQTIFVFVEDIAVIEASL